MNTSKKLTKKHEGSNRAAPVYNERRANIDEILSRIQTALTTHRNRQLVDERDWGYAGDLGLVQKDLAQVLASLGNTSAVKELGLEC